MELKPSASLSVPSLLFSTLTIVNRIKEQYKVSVRIPQDSERSGLVRIEGDPKGVQLARRELIEMVQRMVRRVSLGSFIHSRGRQRTHACKLYFPSPGKRAHQRPDRGAEVPSDNHRPEGGKDQRSSRQVPWGECSPRPSPHFFSPVHHCGFVWIHF